MLDGRTIALLSYRYRKAFEDYARALHKEYPDLTFNGGTFHPGDMRVGLAQVLQLCFFAGIVLAMGGKRMLPEPLQKLIDDNPMAGMMLVFFCNMASGACLNTGAFEVSARALPLHTHNVTLQAGDHILALERRHSTHHCAPWCAGR